MKENVNNDVSKDSPMKDLAEKLKNHVLGTF